LFFYASDPVAGRELWRSDGTAEGTYRVMDVKPGTSGSIGQFVSVPPFVAPTKGGAYFFADDGVHGTEPWFSNGSSDPNGTFLLADIYPTPGFAGAETQSAVVLPDGKLIFVGRNLMFGEEPYISDATAAGTHLLIDLDTRTQDSAPTSIIDAGGGSLILGALPPYVLQDHTRNEFQRALVRVDPATAAVAYLAPNAPPTSESIPFTGRGRVQGASLGGRTYYFSNDDSTLVFYQRLHVTDGTKAGTQTFGTYYAQNGEIAVLGDRLYFTGTPDPATAVVGLYRTDGTVAGTQLVSSPVLSGAANLIVSGDTLYFSVNTELYRITNQDLAAVDIGSAGGGIRNIQKAAGGKIFILRAVEGGSVLTATNDAGTGTGTSLGAVSGAFVTLNDKAYFRGASNNLYVSDGTPQGTRPMVVGGKNITAFNLRAVNGYLYFVSNDGVHGSEWWRSDGTDAGTALWQDMQQGSGGSDPSNIIGVGADFARSIVQWHGLLYFTAQTSATGAELWSVSPTGGTPTLVADLFPGATSSDPAALTIIGDTLYFIAARPDVGREIFRVIDDPPQIVDAAFDPGGLGKIWVRLSESVSIVTAAKPPTLLDKTTGIYVASDSLAASLDPNGSQLTLSPGAALPAGDYRLTIPATWLSDPGGNSLTGFHVRLLRAGGRHQPRPLGGFHRPGHPGTELRHRRQDRRTR
jgi:ELWxxDGT repeat protein